LKSTLSWYEEHNSNNSILTQNFELDWYKLEVEIKEISNENDQLWAKLNDVTE